MKKFTKVFMSLVVSLVVMCGVISIIVVLDDFAPKKPPQITEGEFPFCVEYEMNGQRYILEDTIMCKFTGIHYDSTTLTQHRMWDMSLKSGNEIRHILFREENAPSVLKPKRMNAESELWLDYGSPEYYMGDSIGKGASFEYRETWKISEKGTNTEDSRLNPKELEKHFGIKVIRFEFSKPIKNKFK